MIVMRASKPTGNYRDSTKQNPFRALSVEVQPKFSPVLPIILRLTRDYFIGLSAPLTAAEWVLRMASGRKNPHWKNGTRGRR